jgi:hypothetical protein
VTPPASVSDFERALRSLSKPRGRQLAFLTAHAHAKGRALNMRRVADAAGYKSYRAGNLQYGRLGYRIGKRMGRAKDGLALLVDFLPPRGKSKKNVSNDEWILLMRPNFAKALMRVGWI